MQDLFLPLQTKETQLLDWCKEKGFFSKADIMNWGLKNYYLRADRTIRDFVREGIVRKISKEECVFRGLRGNMGWYEVVK